MKTQTSLVFPVWFSHVHVWQRGDISVLATGQLSFFFSWVKTRKVNLKVCVSGCVQAAILPFASEVINSACLTVCCLWRCREETWCTQHEAGVGISLNRPAQNLCFICQETTKTKCIQAWFNALHFCSILVGFSCTVFHLWLDQNNGKTKTQSSYLRWSAGLYKSSCCGF